MSSSMPDPPEMELETDIEAEAEREVENFWEAGHYYNEPGYLKRCPPEDPKDKTKFRGCFFCDTADDSWAFGPVLAIDDAYCGHIWQDDEWVEPVLSVYLPGYYGAGWSNYLFEIPPDHFVPLPEEDLELCLQDMADIEARVRPYTQLPGGALIPDRDRSCELCGNGPPPGIGYHHFTHIHHVRPRSAGGSDHPLNLIELCASCHSIVHRALFKRTRGDRSQPWTWTGPMTRGRLKQAYRKVTGGKP